MRSPKRCTSRAMRAACSPSFAIAQQPRSGSRRIWCWPRYASQLNDPDSAKTAVETAIELDNGMTTDPYVQAAELAEKLGDQELAARRIKQAYGINPSDRRVLETMQRMGMNPAETSPVPPGR